VTLTTAPQAQKGEKATVLLVEDEADTLELLGRALRRAGYRCIAASDASEALHLAEAAAAIDIVVTDIVLGGDTHGGLHVLTELRKRGTRAPVVLITAYADVSKLKIALNEGAAYCLEKPFGASRLLEVIDQVLSSHKPPNNVAGEVLTQAQLTEKERTVALMLLEGLSSNQIATLQGNSPKTIRQHVSQIYVKCGAANRTEFFRRAYRL
jgi:DNA-binding NarL/FixJ family response regulator